MVVDSRTASEQHIIVRHVDWAEYERILAEHASSSAPRFVYDHGVLEIMSPFPEHENLDWALERLAETAAEALGIDFASLRSTTFRRADLQRGVEPDSCLYLTNVAAVRGKKQIDLLVDPPPDLAIEIDITHSTLDKLAIYAEFGVPEVWRYADEQVAFHIRSGTRYSRRSESLVLPGVTVDAITPFVISIMTANRLTWLREIRAWAATLPH